MIATSAREFPLYLNGEFVKTKDRRPITSPFTGETVGMVHFADCEMVEKAIDYAEEGFKKFRKMPTYERVEILEKIVKGIKRNHEEIATTIVREAAKPIKFARGETSRCMITFKTAAEEAKRMNGEIMPLDWAVSARNRTGYIRRFPIGIISGITPFNFPLNLAAHKIAPAIAAGNSIIIKPASADPMSTLWLAKLADEAGLPKGVLQVLPASSSEIDSMITDDRVKMITFTGSAEVGWSLKANSGKKRVALELGGNAGVIIDRDCNLEYAVQRCLMGGFAYAGQVCISVQRIFIHKNIYDQFIEKFLYGVNNEVKVGDPMDDEVMMSSMIRLDDAVRVESWIKEAVKGGAKVLTGGNRNGAIVDPTVLANVNRDMKVYKDEVFGPVVVVDKFDTFEEAVDKVNDSRFGLQAGVFTNNLEYSMYAFDNIEAGGVNINDVPTFRIDPMPYGGSKDSGFGREGLKYTMEEMTEMKLMVVNRSH